MSQDLKPKNDIERKWGAAIHASAFAGMLFPLALALGPFFIWMLKKHDSEYLDIQGKKAINFQLTVLVIAFTCVLLALLIKPLISLAFMTGIGGLVFAVMAAAISRTASQNTDVVLYLEEKTLASFVAENRLNKIKLSGYPAITTTKDNEEMANRQWHIITTVTETPFPNFRRIEVKVSKQSDKESSLMRFRLS